MRQIATMSSMAQTTGATSGNNPFRIVIERLKNLSVEEEDSHIPSLEELAMDVVKLFHNHHKRIVKDGFLWSEKAGAAVSNVAAYALFPLSLCRAGQTIQHLIAHRLLGGLTQTVVFCALQIRHFFPYIVLTTLIAGTIGLYQTDPMALTALLAGGMLATQLWLLYRLVKTVDATKKMFEQSSVLHPLSSLKNLGARAIRWIVARVSVSG